MEKDSERIRRSLPVKTVGALRSARSSLNNFLSRRSSSTLIILVGIFVISIAIVQGIDDYKKYNSPFDQIDYDSNNQIGLLPLLEAEESIDGANFVAPSLTANQAQSYFENLGPLRDMTANEVLFNKIGLETLANPTNIGLVPDRLIIPKLDLYVDINPVGFFEINFEGDIYKQWDTVDEYATGWHNTSAGIGVPGNTVISGHHNVFGKVFENLYTLQVGDAIQVKTVGNKLVTYRVARVLILEEKYQPLDVRLENARWIQESTNERLTLITCWPNDDNTHRVIVVALPEES